MQNDYPIQLPIGMNRSGIRTNRYYYSREHRPNHEERFTYTKNNPPTAPIKPKYKLTTQSAWFLCPVGRPLRTNTTYFATDKQKFIKSTCYQIYGTWYDENIFTKIEEI